MRSSLLLGFILVGACGSCEIRSDSCYEHGMHCSCAYGAATCPGGQCHCPEPPNDEVEEAPAEAAAPSEVGEVGDSNGENLDSDGEDEPASTTLCASRRPTFESTSLPTSFCLWRQDTEILGTVRIDQDAHLSFEPRAGAVSDPAVVRILERIEADGYVSLSYSARDRTSRARCGLQLPNDVPGFAGAVQHKLRDRGFTMN